MVRVSEKVDELFHTLSGATGNVDLKATFRLFWSTLSNSVSVVDLAGVFAISIPSSSSSEVLTRELFQDFFKAFARLKFNTGVDFCERLLDDIRRIKLPKMSIDTNILSLIADKQVMRILLKYDLPLRRAFSMFCGKGARIGDIASWDEVKSLSLGMEQDGFIAFAGAYSLVPSHLSTQQCEIIFREILSKFPLRSNTNTANSSLLYPQFQLLMASIASERHETLLKKNEKASEKSFARKPLDSHGRHMSDLLHELLKDLGISRFEDGMTFPAQYISSSAIASANTLPPLNMMSESQETTSHNFFTGSVQYPSAERPTDRYHSNLDHARQSMLLRLEQLFDEVHANITKQLSPEDSVFEMLQQPSEECFEVKTRLPSKPVVVGDALPVPAACPDTVDQLLEASLAHHNLGSFDEALKFLEAARIQLQEILISMNLYHHEDDNHLRNGSHEFPYFDSIMYIIVCKGNVYQSCGDDEQSLQHYIQGWNKAKKSDDKDWEIVCVNCVGMLAFFNLRYEVALLCFHLVYQYRAQVYGAECSDTATALNNEASALYCLHKRAEARLRFEKSWDTLVKSIGHRAPRAITVWKNLEKARRSNTTMQSKKDLSETINLRDDAGRLILGGSFTIQAIPPPTAAKKKRSLGKKKK